VRGVRAPGVGTARRGCRLRGLGLACQGTCGGRAVRTPLRSYGRYIVRRRRVPVAVALQWWHAGRAASEHGDGALSGVADLCTLCSGPACALLGCAFLVPLPFMLLCLFLGLCHGCVRTFLLSFALTFPRGSGRAGVRDARVYCCVRLCLCARARAPPCMQHARLVLTHAHICHRALVRLLASASGAVAPSRRPPRPPAAAQRRPERGAARSASARRLLRLPSSCPNPASARMGMGARGARGGNAAARALRSVANVT
jgi:hypothetical protein